MAAQVDLTRTAITQSEAELYSLFKMTVTVNTVTGTDLFDENLFLFQREVINVSTNTKGDTCVGVASIPDVAEYPVGAPDTDSGTYQYFRKNSVTLVFRSYHQGDKVWERIQKSIQALCNAADIVVNESFQTSQDYEITASAVVEVE